MLNDLDILFSDFAVDVVWGGSTFKAIFDMPDEVLSGGLVISTEYLIMCKSSDIVGLLDGEVLTVGGVTYEVRQIRQVDDGKISRVLLSKI